MDAQDVLYATEKILAILPAEQQQTIRSLLERARQGEKVDNFIVDELAKNRRIRQWLKQALGLDRSVEMAYDPLAGDIGDVSAEMYVCPEGDFAWEVRRAGQPIPPCPVHNVPLVPQTSQDGDR